MEKDIKLGSDGDVDFQLVDAHLVVKLNFKKALGSSGTEVDLSLGVKQDAKLILDKLVAAVPAGWVHDALAAAERAALALAAPAAAPAPAAMAEPSLAAAMMVGDPVKNDEAPKPQGEQPQA